MEEMVSLGRALDEFFGDINYSKDSKAGKLYPFKVRVACVKMCAPRHERFEYLRDMGMVNIDRLFKGESLDGGHLTFVFPERWMGVHEQHSFMHVLSKHPDAKNIKQVDIITSNPMIIGSVMPQQLRIVTFKDDDKHNGKPEFASWDYNSNFSEQNRE